jgi:hypothetical protein
MDLNLFKRAGARRARRAEDFKGDVTRMFEGVDTSDPFALAGLLARLRGEHPPIGGGAPGLIVVGTSIGALTYAASPGVALLTPLVPTSEVPLNLAVGYVDAVLWTAAAESTNFAYGSTAGTAITGATLYRSRVTVRTAIQTPDFVMDFVPLAGLNTYNWLCGVAAGGAGATVATTNAAFAILPFA